MVHRSMGNGSKVVNEVVSKERLFGVGEFTFLLSLFVLLYRNQQARLCKYSDSLSLSLSLDTHFEFSPISSLSPAPHPARYMRTSPRYTHLIADVLSTLPDSLPWFV